MMLATDLTRHIQDLKCTEREREIIKAGFRACYLIALEHERQIAAQLFAVKNDAFAGLLIDDVGSGP